ncbi:hypothetical protein [Treponema sp. R6D11]
MEKFVQFIKDSFQKLTALQKRSFAVICTLIFAGILTISVIASLKTNGGEKKEDKLPETVIIAPIPPEELFLPDEPDYIPGVLLKRDKKSNWTEEDAMEYWQDPLKNGEEQWREKIESSIDDYLERVP